MDIGPESLTATACAGPVGVHRRVAVEFDGVTVAFGPRVALDGVGLGLVAGEFAFLVGASGAGKTTLLKLINGELRPTKGRLWVDGLSVHALPRRQLSSLRRRVGVIFQDFKLLPRLTTVENVIFALQAGDLRISRREARERALDALEAVGLADRSDAFPNQLSGGQQQRVAIARGMVRVPPLLIADEPTGNLDMDNAWQIMELLERVARFGTTVLVATHNPEIVRSMGKRILALAEGRLVADHPARVAGWAHGGWGR